MKKNNRERAIIVTRNDKELDKDADPERIVKLYSENRARIAGRGSRSIDVHAKQPVR